jgi:polynucleotide 5'-hydroxyl-kinase GRC3/NOL9
MPLIKLIKGELLKIYGPMSLVVKSGCLDIYGKELCTDEKAIIHRARNYIVEAISDVEIDITMVNESQIQSVEEGDPYIKRREIASKIVQRGCERVIIVGCVDCGKTSLATLIFNIALRSGKKPGVIDGDVGQADIGPPGYITLGTSESPVLWISELKPISMKFIGDIKPQYYTQSIISKLKELVQLSENLSLSPVVIDTDGWIKDEIGVLYKYGIINEVKPDTIVVLGNELRGLFEKYRKLGVTVYEIEAPISRKTRSREERRQIRSLRYREFLEKASLVRLNLDSIIVEGFPLLQGVQFDTSTLSRLVEGQIIYASRLPNTLYVHGNIKSYNIEELKKMGFEKIKIFAEGFEKNLYCAVTDERGNDYPCIIGKVDFEKREVLVRTSYAGNIRVLKISRIRLTPDYTEEYVEV